jgi:hypothetical protein
MEAMLKDASTLFLDCKFTRTMLNFELCYLGSCSKSINSMDEYSILCTTLETRVTK